MRISGDELVRGGLQRIPIGPRGGCCGGRKLSQLLLQLLVPILALLNEALGILRSGRQDRILLRIDNTEGDVVELMDIVKRAAVTSTTSSMPSFMEDRLSIPKPAVPASTSVRNANTKVNFSLIVKRIL